MKQYEAPDIIIIRFETEDVITASASFAPSPNEGDLDGKNIF